MKKFLILSVVLVIGLIIVYTGFIKEEAISSQVNYTPEELVVASLPQASDTEIVDVIEEEEVEPVVEPHPVSLPALFNKQFVGKDLVLGKVLVDNSVYTRYYIEYSSGDLTISGIMNVPKGTGPWPVLILAHGYIDPAIYTNGRGLKREQDYLARRGYIVIHPDYRNHASSSKDPDTEFNFRLGYTEDVINAIMAVKNSGLEIFKKDNIGILGHSMGGGVALNIMVVKPDLVKGVVLFAPVNALAKYNFERWTKERTELAKKIIDTYGSPEDNSEFWANLSPATFFSRVNTPVLLHHGTADKDVPILWSEELEDWLLEASKKIEFQVYEKEPHEFAIAWPLVMERTVEFFDEYVK